MVKFLEKKGAAAAWDTVCLNREGDGIRIIDQTRLPGEAVFLELKTQEEICRAIRRLEVRGAPAIGVTAGFAYYLAARELALSENLSMTEFFQRLAAAKACLASTRPTAVNLVWALERMERIAADFRDLCLKKKEEFSPGTLCGRLKREALKIYREDIRVCQAIGEAGFPLLQPGWGILTHCNAGRLACVRYGTATAPLYLAKEKGYDLRVYVDETRPLLQGARLTAYELAGAGINVTLLCDNMAAAVMARGWVQAVFTGADRVAANGDTANKIGTSGLAVLARYYGIPFYICAPSSTIDLATPEGNRIRIEERDPAEVTKLWYERPMAPDGVKVFNPAFDVTEHSLISGIITEFGVVYPPFSEKLADLVRRERKTAYGRE